MTTDLDREREQTRTYPPSTYAIHDLLEGRPGALVRVLGLTLCRALFVAPGLFLVGVRRPAQLAGYSLAASASISAMMALYQLSTRGRR
jgi:hypothetical protein